MCQSVAQNRRLLGNFLGHEMLVSALFDPGLVDADLLDLAVGGAVLMVENFGTGTGDEGMIAFFQIADTVGHGGECNGV